jgi:hypothetical protein
VNELIQALQVLLIVALALLPVVGVIVLFVAGYRRMTGRSTRLGPAADGVVRAMNAGVFPFSLRTVQYDPGPEMAEGWAGDDLDPEPKSAPVIAPSRRRTRRSVRLRRGRV